MGIVRNDQAQIPPRQFANGFRRGRDAMRVVEGLQQLSEFAVAPTRYGQHEFQRLTPVQTNFRQGVEVVQREQTPIRHQHLSLIHI